MLLMTEPYPRLYSPAPWLTLRRCHLGVPADRAVGDAEGPVVGDSGAATAPLDVSVFSSVVPDTATPTRESTEPLSVVDGSAVEKVDSFSGDVPGGDRHARDRHLVRARDHEHVRGGAAIGDHLRRSGAGALDGLRPGSSRDRRGSANRSRRGRSPSPRRRDPIACRSEQSPGAPAQPRAHWSRWSC